MFPRFRGRPAFFERTPRGRERIVLERRHSDAGRHRRADSSDDDDDPRDQDRRLLAENHALHSDNQRLLRDNQALTRHLYDVRNDRDRLAQEVRRESSLEEIIRDLRRRLDREKRRVREERAEREEIDRERLERARGVAEELRRLREAERRRRAEVVELMREVEGWIRVNADKEGRIRVLEGSLRRLGIGGVR